MVGHHASPNLYTDDIEEADDDDVGNEDDDDEYNEITEAPPVLTANNLPLVPIKNLMPDPPNLSGMYRYRYWYFPYLSTLPWFFLPLVS